MKPRVAAVCLSLSAWMVVSTLLFLPPAHAQKVEPPGQSSASDADRAYEHFVDWAMALPADKRPRSENEAFEQYRTFLTGRSLSANDADREIELIRASAGRAYERFRYWTTTLPADQRPGNDDQLFAKYRAFLTGRGKSPGEADREIKLVRDNASRNEIEMWNRVLTAANPSFNTQPNAFLVEIGKGRKPGTALDVGMGQGRNAIWLAQQGWDVTGFDPAERAVALANETAKKLGVKLTTEIKKTEDFDFGESRWDMILVSYAGGREVPAKLERALKPGGILVIEAFHRDAARGGSIADDVTFATGELPTLFPHLRVVRYEEPLAMADFGQEKVRVVRYCGQRPQ